MLENLRTQKSIQYISATMLGLSGLVLIGFQQAFFGWALYGLALLFTAVGTSGNFRKHILLLYVSLGLLGLSPISTDYSNKNFLIMGSLSLVILLLPHLVTRYVYKEDFMGFRFNVGRKWTGLEIAYLIVLTILAYLLLPIYLRETGAFLNWTVESTGEGLARLFVGVNILGIWDELFFISTVLVILKRYLIFSWANITQAILFTSFLYELGFIGWGPLVIFPFALFQGYLYQRTKSLFYIILIHLSVDYVLYLALINAHHPDLADIFIT